MLSFGIEASFAFWIALYSAALDSGSPPPSRAATLIARASFVNWAPRRASTIAFLCLLPAHFECPDTTSILRAAPGGPGPWASLRPGHAAPTPRCGHHVACRVTDGARPRNLQGL